ncbi:MAG: 1,4-dihydroxy-2-naphthoate octaprenyltransferase [Paraglaciecola sp.]|jgi:1,4-dihydroxy-2-naphthoate octaprenyltransferase
MNKAMKVLTTLGLFAGVALIVYIAGELALSNSPLGALVPVGVLLLIIIVYIRLNDKKD